MAATNAGDYILSMRQVSTGLAVTTLLVVLAALVACIVGLVVFYRAEDVEQNSEQKAVVKVFREYNREIEAGLFLGVFAGFAVLILMGVYTAKMMRESASLRQ